MSNVVINPSFSKRARFNLGTPAQNGWYSGATAGAVGTHKAILDCMAFTFPLQPIYDIGAARVITGALNLFRDGAGSNNQDTDAHLTGPGVGNIIDHTAYADTGAGATAFIQDCAQTASNVYTFTRYSNDVGTFTKGTSKTLSLQLTEDAMGSLIQSIGKKLSHWSVGFRYGTDGPGVDSINAIHQLGAANPPELEINFLKIEPYMRNKDMKVFYSPTNPLASFERELGRDRLGRFRE